MLSFGPILLKKSEYCRLKNLQARTLGEKAGRGSRGINAEKVNSVAESAAKRRV